MADYVFDMDGTLANIDHRLHFLDENPPNWKDFNYNYFYDLPVEPVIKMAQALHADLKNRIVILTGREGTDRGHRDTVMWLEEHNVPYDALYMRHVGDQRRDDVIKREILATMRENGFHPFAVFDDRPQVVRMWREEGIFVFDVNTRGEF